MLKIAAPSSSPDRVAISARVAMHDIIAPLTKMTMPELMRFTRMTGDLVKAMRACPQPIVAD